MEKKKQEREKKLKQNGQKTNNMQDALWGKYIYTEHDTQEHTHAPTHPQIYTGKKHTFSKNNLSNNDISQRANASDNILATKPLYCLFIMNI